MWPHYDAIVPQLQMAKRFWKVVLQLAQHTALRHQSVMRLSPESEDAIGCSGINQ